MSFVKKTQPLSLLPHAWSSPLSCPADSPPAHPQQEGPVLDFSPRALRSTLASRRMEARRWW